MFEHTLTEHTMKIVGISGSLRTGSVNTALLHNAADLLPEGVELEVIDMNVFPLFNQDIEKDGLPEELLAVQKTIAEADGVLIASPEYNYSYTGVLKNAIDWLSRPPYRALNEKPVAIVGASPGQFGTARGQYQLRGLLHGINAHVLSKPEVLIGGSMSKFSEDGKLVDQKTRDFYASMLETFVQYINRMTPEKTTVLA